MDKTLHSAYPIIALLLDKFGAWGSVGLLVILYLMAFGWKKYNEIQRDKEIKAALAEKEKSVQILANEVRMWRIAELKEKRNWTDEQIERFLITEEFRTPKEAREFFSSRKDLRNKEGKKDE